MHLHAWRCSGYSLITVILLLKILKMLRIFIAYYCILHTLHIAYKTACLWPTTTSYLPTLARIQPAELCPKRAYPWHVDFWILFKSFNPK